MSTKDTKTEVDFTADQIIEALRQAGWQLPQAGTEDVTLVEDGRRFKVKWQESEPEVPI
jgi:hypothetical protein